MPLGSSRGRRLWSVVLIVAALVPLESSARAGAGGDTDPWFELSGGGWGHGVGLSQYGARGRADAGHSYDSILAAYYQGATLTQMAPSGIRVRLAGATSTSLSQAGGALAAGPDGAGAVVASTALSLWVAGGSVMAQGPGGTGVALGPTAVVSFTQGLPVTVGATGRRYRWGRLVVRVDAAGSLEVVLDQLAVEQWMYGIAEVPASWPLAALQAQAVAARSFGAHRLVSPRSSRYDVDALAGDGTYLGYDHEASAQGARWIQAVDSTSRQILTWSGAPITAFYSSSNGGHSEASSYVFVASLPYLVATPDPYDHATGNANHAWTERYRGAELGAWLRAAGKPDVGNVVGFDVLGGVGASGRVDKAAVRVRGSTGGAFTLTGAQLRSAINAGAPSDRELLSTKFGIGGAGGPGAVPGGALELAFPWGDAAIVVGWTADADAPAAPLGVKVYVDGKLAGQAVADLARADLAAALPWLGARHGYAAIVRAPGPSATVCVDAVDVGGGPDTRLGCRVITRAAPAPPSTKATTAKKATKKRAGKKLVKKKAAKKPVRKKGDR